MTKTSIVTRAIPIDAEDITIEDHELKLYIWQQYDWARFKMDKKDALDLYNKLGEALGIDKQENKVSAKVYEELTVGMTQVFDLFREQHGQQRSKAEQPADYLEHEVKTLITQIHLSQTKHVVPEEQAEKLRAEYHNNWPEVELYYHEAVNQKPNTRDRTFYATRDNPSSAFVDIWVNDKPTLEFYVDKNGKEKSCWLGDDDCLADSSVTVQECMALFGFCPGLEELVIFSVSTSAKQVKTEEDIEEKRLEEDALMTNLPPSYVFSTPNAIKGFYQTKSRDNNSEIRCVCGNVVGLRHIPKGSDEQVKRWFSEAQEEFHRNLRYKGNPKGCIGCFPNGLRLAPKTQVADTEEGIETKDPQIMQIRTEFCEPLDRTEKLSDKNRASSLLRCAKETLYQLDVLNGDIKEG